jgi:hypothetical protein
MWGPACRPRGGPTDLTRRALARDAAAQLAANHVAMGELELADAALRRGAYMLKRAYRPSGSAAACLLNVHGTLHEAHGDTSAALAAHTEAHAKLCAAEAARDAPDRFGGWLQACRHGSVWAMVRSGSAAAAETLAAADLSAERLDGLDVRERAFARGRHAVATLQRTHDEAVGTAGTRTADAASREGQRTEALQTLIGVAETLAATLGESHRETRAAWANVDVAHAAAATTRASTGVLCLAWQQHWQPALGVGLAAGLRALQPSSAT